MKVVNFDKSCPSGKRRFESEHLARKALGRSQAKRTRGVGPTLRGVTVERRPYYCDFCDGYHLTHQNNRRRTRRITAEQVMAAELAKYAMA